MRVAPELGSHLDLNLTLNLKLVFGHAITLIRFVCICSGWCYAGHVHNYRITICSINIHMFT